MADMSLGTMVVRVLVAGRKGNIESPDLTHVLAHEARQQLIDAIKHYRTHETLVNQSFFNFTPTALQPSYDLTAAPISKNVRRVERLWYDDSTGAIYPRDGLTPVSFEDLQRHLKAFDSSTASAYVSACAYHENKLWLTPYPDGIFKVHVSAVVEAKVFQYRRESGDWKYEVDGVDKAGVTIDDETDTTFNALHNLYESRALAELYGGEWQDDKGIMYPRFKRKEDDERDRLIRERERILPEQPITPFLPGG